MTELSKSSECVKNATLGRPWTSEELTELECLLAAGHDADEIAFRLDRSTWAIRARRTRLKALRKQHVGFRYCPPVGPIAERVARHFEVRLSDMRGPTNFAKWCWPRQVAMWVAVESTCSYMAVARYFRRNHTTVLHALRKVERCRAASPTDTWLTDMLLAEARQNAPLPQPAAVVVPEPAPPPEVETPDDDPPYVAQPWQSRFLNPEDRRASR